MLNGEFVNLDSATLASLKVNVVAAITAVLVAHQSYSIAGRTFTRANLGELNTMLREINYAQTIQAGYGLRTVRVDMSGTI